MMFFRKLIFASLLIMPFQMSYAQSNFPADYNHIIAYGQSLSVGSIGGMYINSTGLPYSNIWMFNNGLRYEKGEADSSMKSFVPLIEHTRGETTASGTADMLMKSLIKDKNKVDYNFVFRTPGAGGKSVKVLRRNTVQPFYYESAIRGVKRGKYIADQHGKTFNVPAFTWTQGEADISAGMGLEEYKTQFGEMYSEMNKDIKDITGQSNDVVSIMYQTASHNRYYLGSVKQGKFLNTNIAVAQYQMALANNKVYMATPMYPFDFGPDNVHLYPENARLLGAYYGYVTKKVLVDKVDWKPVYPMSIHATGKVLKLKMHVPVKPLVIDTDWVQFVDNYGFNIYRDDKEIAIKAVKVTGADEITIWANEDLKDNDRITYAINGQNSGRFIGSRGNIRDSQGNTVTYDIGCTTYKLHNWLPIFEESIKDAKPGVAAGEVADVVKKENNILTQPMSTQPVFGYAVKDVAGENTAVAYHEFTSKSDGLFQVEFFLKIVPRSGTAQVDLQYLDPTKGSYVTLTSLPASQMSKAIYNQWTKYTFPYKAPGFENKKGNKYRLAFNFVKGDVGKGLGLLKAHENNSFFVTGINSVYASAPKMANGNFELWDAAKWPAKPVDWKVVEGAGCAERFRGHLLDDYALKLSNPVSKLTRVAALTAVPLKNKKYTLHFYARGEQNGQKIEWLLSKLKQNKSFTLDKTWRPYSMEVTGADVAELLELRYAQQGVVYVDEIAFIER